MKNILSSNIQKEKNLSKQIHSFRKKSNLQGFFTELLIANDNNFPMAIINTSAQTQSRRGDQEKIKTVSHAHGWIQIIIITGLNAL